VIRDAATTVVLANVLGLRESSVMSLITSRAQNITHTATNEDVSERKKAFWHPVLATHARTGVAYLLPSRFDGSAARHSHGTDAVGLLEEV
jgi:hypothetical protein